MARRSRSGSSPGGKGRPARAPARPCGAEYSVPASARLPDGRIEAAAVRALYDGEVRYVDSELGRLLGRLRAAGLLEQTIVVLTADHGESLGEQRYFFEHGRNVSEACCAVPLVVRVPHGRRGREPQPISLCSVQPLLLGWLGLGREAALARAVGYEKIERADLPRALQHKAVRIGRWKLVRRFTVENGAARVAAEELYDLERDPREERDLFAAPPAEAPLARLEAELLAFSAADVRFADLGRKLAAERQALDAESLRILEALGY